MRDVIEAIDNALEDWEVSGDAMRWTPEVASEPIRRAATFDQVMEAGRRNVEEGSRRSAVWSLREAYVRMTGPHLHWGTMDLRSDHRTPFSWEQPRVGDWDTFDGQWRELGRQFEATRLQIALSSEQLRRDARVALLGEQYEI